MIGLVVVSDGRWPYLAQCLDSLSLLSGIGERVLVNDSGGPVPFSLPGWQIVDHEKRRGLAGAVQSAWATATDLGWRHLFHLEEDFVFRAPVDAARLAEVVERMPELAQIVCKRQAWSEEEQAAGGIVEMAPDDYRENGPVTVHSRFFSLNPCLVPRDVFVQGWPVGNEAEQTRRMVDQGMRSAFWGGKFDPPIVEHIGYQRSAGWAL